MVYSGPSKACAMCKRRHIKCDETRPTCRNCQKRQLPCPGYTPEPGIRFHDETDNIISQAQQRENRSLQRPAGQSAAPTPRTSPQDAETAALNFFFDNYATLGRGSESSDGFFENIVPIYANTASSSAMSAATSAVALTLVSEWHGRVEEIPLARRHLGKALSLLRTSLNDPEQSLTDDTMMAVLLLKFHDMLGAWKKLQDVPEDHINGAIALVKHRRLSSFNTNISKRMLQYVRHTAITCALQRRTPLASDPELWNNPDSMVSNPNVELDGIAFHVANLRASAGTCSILLFDPTSAATFDEKQKQEIRDVREQAADLDLKLAGWADQRTGRWRPTRVSDFSRIDPSIAVAGLYLHHCDLYPSSQVAHTWNHYRGYRLFVLEIILHCDRLLNVTVGHRRNSYPTVCQSVIDDLCASIPFLLGNRTEPGSIDEFDLPRSIRFPSHQDDGEENPDNLEMDMFMTEEQRTKNLLAQGPWQVHDHLGQVVRGVQSSRFVIRDGQLEWIQGQMRRVMRIQRITNTRTSQSPDSQGESSTLRETFGSLQKRKEGAQQETT